MKTKLLFFGLTLFLSVFSGFAQDVVHLTGAGVGGWNNPKLAQDLMTSTDGIIHTITNIVLTLNIMLFRDNQSWDIKFGVNGSASSNNYSGGITS